MQATTLYQTGKNNLSANGYNTIIWYIYQVLTAVELKVIELLVPSHPAV